VIEGTFVLLGGDLQRLLFAAESFLRQTKFLDGQHPPLAYSTAGARRREWIHAAGQRGSPCCLKEDPAMRAKVINESPERTIALIFDQGDEVMSILQHFAKEHALTASRFSAIGALQEAVLGYFDWERKDYERIAVDEQVEVLSLNGDIAMEGSEPKVHAHTVLGRRDGSTVGGHLLQATVRPTLEVLLIESPGYLRKRCDPESGLALIDIGA
jgi:Predicted DNA-binding protein with PD1-like DNA-binding motif